MAAADRDGVSLYMFGGFASGGGLMDDTWAYQTPWTLDVNGGPAKMPNSFTVSPNPARHVVAIDFRVGNMPVRVEVVDLAGRRLRTLSPTGSVAGRVAWDGFDDAGRPCPGGLYFVRAVFANSSSIRRLVLL
jgi:hypothetical protein